MRINSSFNSFTVVFLRAARNVSAGRHWPAGRTLRTYALKRVHWWVLQEVPDDPRGRGAGPVPRRVQRPVRRVQGAARRGAGRTQEVRRDGRHDAHVAPATQQPDGDWLQPRLLPFFPLFVCLFVCLIIIFYFRHNGPYKITTYK